MLTSGVSGLIHFTTAALPVQSPARSSFTREGDRRPALAGRHDDHAGGAAGGGHESKRLVVRLGIGVGRAVQAAKPPEFLAVGEGVAGDAVGPVHDEKLAAVVPVEKRRRVGVLALELRRS